MRSLFRSKHRITQIFGPDHFLTINGVEIKASVYYGKYGLKGHEGLDLVPTGTVWDMLCLADGVVVKDEDNAMSGVYGNYVTVWHPKLRKATQYCHLKENYVTDGQIVSIGDKLGLMGNSGNTSGAHAHLNLYDVDDNGIRLNKDNGYNGGIDPLPFLQEDVTIPQMPADQILVPKTQLEDFQRVKDGWNKVREKLDVQDSVPVVIAEIDKFLTLEEALRKQENQLTDAQAEANNLRGQIKEEKEKNEQLAKEAFELVQKALDLEKKYTEAVSNNEKALKRITDLEKDLAVPDTGWTLIRKGIEKLLRR